MHSSASWPIIIGRLSDNVILSFFLSTSLDSNAQKEEAAPDTGEPPEAKGRACRASRRCYVEVLGNAVEDQPHHNESPYAPAGHLPMAIPHYHWIEMVSVHSDRVPHHRRSMIVSVIGTVKGGLSFMNGSARSCRACSDGGDPWADAPGGVSLREAPEWTGSQEKSTTQHNLPYECGCRS
jgi:hypothetical protein